MGGFDFTDDHHEEVDVDKYAKGSEKYYLSFKSFLEYKD